MPDPFSTHDVFNQPPPLADINLFTSDAALRDAVAREGSGAAFDALTVLGALSGRAEAFERGRLANEYPPRLFAFDAVGRRRDFVEYHPAYHSLMETSFGAGLHSSSWSHLGTATGIRSGGGSVVRAAACFMTVQPDAGHCHAISMTNAAIPVLKSAEAVGRTWLPKVLSRTYDPRFVPHRDKVSVTFGLGLTERQGGTDLKAATTAAVPGGRRGSGEPYELTGHKWFLSAPMADAFLVLAQSPGGLGCFFLPRFTPDGELNAIRLVRLKDKLGNRSDASAEIELDGAEAWLIGDEGRGLEVIAEVLLHVRFDSAVALAGLTRFALALACHHACHRIVFTKKLADQPLMLQLLADAAIDVEAATALVLRLARSFDRVPEPHAAAWRRLMTPVTKFWIACTAAPLVAATLECVGGNACVETGPLARIYRDVPAVAMWAGDGNAMALDVLSILRDEPETAERVMSDIARAIGDDRHLNAAFARVEDVLHDPRRLDERARLLADSLATLAAGAILKQDAPQHVADTFIATRLGNSPKGAYGTAAIAAADARAIVARASLECPPGATV